MPNEVVVTSQAMREVVMKITLSRVFVFRIWLGVCVLKIGMWIIGGRAEVGAVE